MDTMKSNEILLIKELLHTIHPTPWELNHDKTRIFAYNGFYVCKVLDERYGELLVKTANLLSRNL